ncbi:hypothetical protein [Pseudoalteromonas sp. MMG013]|nr:hypothetical protein [Pseudoalteromonas sp. MMG013]
MTISIDTIAIVISNGVALFTAVTVNKTDIRWLKDAVKEIKQQIK